MLHVCSAIRHATRSLRQCVNWYSPQARPRVPRCCSCCRAGLTRCCLLWSALWCLLAPPPTSLNVACCVFALSMLTGRSYRDPRGCSPPTAGTSATAGDRQHDQGHVRKPAGICSVDCAVLWCISVSTMAHTATAIKMLSVDLGREDCWSVLQAGVRIGKAAPFIMVAGKLHGAMPSACST